MSASHPIPPETLGDLKQMIVRRDVNLSRRMETVMRHVLAEPETIAFGSIKMVAESAKVSPATVQRIAACFGFGSFRELRSLFRDHLSDLSTRRAKPET